MRVRGRHFLFGSVLMSSLGTRQPCAEMDYPSVWHCDDAKFHWYCDNEPDLSRIRKRPKHPRRAREESALEDLEKMRKSLRAKRAWL